MWTGRSFLERGTGIVRSKNPLMDLRLPSRIARLSEASKQQPRSKTELAAAWKEVEIVFVPPFTTYKEGDAAEADKTLPIWALAVQTNAVPVMVTALSASLSEAAGAPDDESLLSAVTSGASCLNGCFSYCSAIDRVMPTNKQSGLAMLEAIIYVIKRTPTLLSLWWSKHSDSAPSWQSKGQFTGYCQPWCHLAVRAHQWALWVHSVGDPADTPRLK